MAKAKHEHSWMIFKIGLLVVLGLCVFLIYVFWGGEIAAWNATRGYQSTFEPKLKDYWAEANDVITKAGGVDRGPQNPSRSGKAIWVNVNEIVQRSSYERTFKIDPDAGYLPAELHAQSPDEVQTVVLIYVDTASVGAYVTEDGITGPDARKRSVDIRVVDIKNKKYLGRKVFNYGVKQEIHLGESGSAQRDSAEIINWYSSLPAK